MRDNDRVQLLEKLNYGLERISHWAGIRYCFIGVV